MMNLREIDRLIAEKVMGWKIYADSAGYKFWSINEDDSSRIICSVTSFEPSTDIRDAWLVVEKLRETKIFSLYDAWDGDDNKIFCAVFEYNDTYHVVDYKGYADTAPLAICLAALKAVGVEVEVNEQ
jgi:Phage ABA sandwich domain